MNNIALFLALLGALCLAFSAIAGGPILANIGIILMAISLIIQIFKK